jgi:hypothetical protein
MRRLRVATWVLAAILVALIARMIVSGPKFATELSAAIIALVLIGALRLTRMGRRIQPARPATRHRNPQSRRPTR